MSRQDWFRNTSWDPKVESAFLERLARTRDKNQCLRIQASILATRCPDVALRLLGQYFTLGEHFEMAQAYVDQATAYVALNEVQSAITAYESALRREQQYPNLQTQAGIELALLIAERRLSERYDQAIILLQTHKERLLFPDQTFRWNCALALIRSEQGSPIESREAARRALAAAAETRSGFQHHPKMGLVGNVEASIRQRLSELAA
jgi:hypothetical protein